MPPVMSISRTLSICSIFDSVWYSPSLAEIATKWTGWSMLEKSHTDGEGFDSDRGLKKKRMLDLKLATDTWSSLPHNLVANNTLWDLMMPHNNIFSITINLRYYGIGCATDSDRWSLAGISLSCWWRYRKHAAQGGAVRRHCGSQSPRCHQNMPWRVIEWWAAGKSIYNNIMVSGVERQHRAILH